MSADVQIASLLRIAAEDLQGARLLAASGNRNAVYLCSQAAEKVIRAVLTSEGVHAGIKHLLREMVDRVPDENPLKPLLRAIEHLGAYATTFRYPTTAGRVAAPPGTTELDKYTASVDAALQAAATAFAVDLADPRRPAGRPGPVR
ncbi:MAG: HEPN domain-containing protein [Myxococcota bacterium]